MILSHLIWVLGMGTILPCFATDHRRKEMSKRQTSKLRKLVSSSEDGVIFGVLPWESHGKTGKTMGKPWEKPWKDGENWFFTWSFYGRLIEHVKNPLIEADFDGWGCCEKKSQDGSVQRLNKVNKWTDHDRPTIR